MISPRATVISGRRSPTFSKASTRRTGSADFASQLGLVFGRVATLLVDREPEAAAVLLGKGDALAADYAHARHHIEAVEHATELLDSSLGPARRHELYSHGVAISDAEAVECADAAIARYLAQEST